MYTVFCFTRHYPTLILISTKLCGTPPFTDAPEVRYPEIFLLCFYFQEWMIWKLYFLYHQPSGDKKITVWWYFVVVIFSTCENPLFQSYVSPDQGFLTHKDVYGLTKHIQWFYIKSTLGKIGQSGFVLQWSYFKKKLYAVYQIEDPPHWL